MFSMETVAHISIHEWYYVIKLIYMLIFWILNKKVKIMHPMMMAISNTETSNERMIILYEVLKNTMSTRLQVEETDVGNINIRGLLSEVKKLYLLSCVGGNILQSICMKFKLELGSTMKWWAIWLMERQWMSFTRARLWCSCLQHCWAPAWEVWTAWVT